MNPVASVWYGVDPLTEKYPNMSAYVYCAGNPIVLIDPNGKSWYKNNKTGKFKFFWDKGIHKGYTYMGDYLDNSATKTYYSMFGDTYKMGTLEAKVARNIDDMLWHQIDDDAKFTSQYSRQYANYTSFRTTIDLRPYYKKPSFLSSPVPQIRFNYAGCEGNINIYNNHVTLYIAYLFGVPQKTRIYGGKKYTTQGFSGLHGNSMFKMTGNNDKNPALVVNNSNNYNIVHIKYNTETRIRNLKYINALIDYRLNYYRNKKNRK
jgi:hypothetical protein